MKFDALDEKYKSLEQLKSLKNYYDKTIKNEEN